MYALLKSGCVCERELKLLPGDEHACLWSREDVGCFRSTLASTYIVQSIDLAKEHGDFRFLVSKEVVQASQSSFIRPIDTKFLVSSSKVARAAVRSPARKSIRLDIDRELSQAQSPAY